MYWSVCSTDNLSNIIACNLDVCGEGGESEGGEGVYLGSDGRSIGLFIMYGEMR